MTKIDAHTAKTIALGVLKKVPQHVYDAIREEASKGHGSCITNYLTEPERKELLSLGFRLSHCNPYTGEVRVTWS